MSKSEQKLFETKRCIIRSFVETDLDIFMDYRNNKEWMKYQGFKGLTRNEYRTSLLVPFVIENGSQVAIVLKESNLIIGDLYLKRDRDIVYIGYTIHPNYARQGLILEVVKELVDYVSKTYPSCTLQAEMDLGNTASKNLALKLGFICLKDNNDGYICTLNTSK